MKGGTPRNLRDGRERTQRQLRVGELLRHALVEILARGELRDPDLVGVSVTVSEVRVSPDLRNATVFVMPLGGERGAELVEALGRASPYLRRLIAPEIQLRTLPALSFMLDTSFDEVDRIDHLLRSSGVAPDLAPAEAGDGGDGDGVRDGHDGEDRDGA